MARGAKRGAADGASSAGKRKRRQTQDPPLDLDGGDGAETGAALQVSNVPARTDSATFESLGLKRWIVENTRKLGMHHPTDIQAMCIPPAVAGKNVAGNSKTGTGKTACYCLPILHHLSEDPFGVFALVVLPVRELAFQVAENFRALGKSIGVQVGEVVGGREMAIQSNFISGRMHVIIATPGRLADLLRCEKELAKSFRSLRMFVMDEADQLLTSTFEEPLAEIGAVLPRNRQTLLFSATLTSSIGKLSSLIPGLVFMDSNPEDTSLDTLTQEYIFVPQVVQFCYVYYLLTQHFEGQSCIVFAPRIEMCQLLTTMLEYLKLPVVGLHSLQSQRQRQACLGKFKANYASILVATDVACRGLDIPKVAAVINIGLPLGTDVYIHRAGRTARAGRPGLVVSIMSENDVPKVEAIEHRIGRHLELRETDEEAALKLLSKTTKARQKADLLLADAGFEDQVAEHRSKRTAMGRRGK